MGKYNKNLRIELIYHQLFSPGCIRSYRSISMPIDDGVKDIRKFTETLEEMAANMPAKEKCRIGLNNCETTIIYDTEIHSETDLREVEDFLGYLFNLKPDLYQPLFIHISPIPAGYIGRVEEILNRYGKTIMPSKADLSFLDKKKDEGLFGRLTRQLFKADFKVKYHTRVMNLSRHY